MYYNKILCICHTTLPTSFSHVPLCTPCLPLLAGAAKETCWNGKVRLPPNLASWTDQLGQEHMLLDYSHIPAQTHPQC